ncbi:8476_t:CDS:2 [Ambispora leptoticha]|uniref:8476_t:CDS:1 n=1 Tax=Ambispora leptoticha TaxID=144679 RepID=A0A9N9BYE8_9GLOM|nr:8476_t:CDS:2 [Ambispora leptoticha]
MAAQNEIQEEFPDLPELVHVPKPITKNTNDDNKVAPNNDKENEPETEHSKEKDNEDAKESRKVTVVDCEETEDNDIKNNEEQAGEKSGSTNVTSETNENTTSIQFDEIGPRDEDADRVYDLSKPISQRVEIAVQRYKKNRKFNAVRNQVFESYMRFGGIETGPKAFQGQGDEEDGEADAEEIRERRAVNFVEEDRVEGMEVDFTYTVTVYLSSYLIDKSGYVYMDQFVEAPIVVISFINYLVNQRVCPEYNDDMQRALTIAKQAKIELPLCKRLAQLTPGRFNKACSLLFGGELFGLLDDPWEGEEKAAKMLGISMSEAKSIFREVTGQEHAAVNLNNKMTRISEEMDVIDIDSHPISTPFDPNVSNSTQDNSTQNNSENDHDTTNPTSTIPIENGANFENVAPNSLYRIYVRKHDHPESVLIPILIGPELAKNVIRGMFITADFYQLNNGVWYWDRVTNVYPTYFLQGDPDSDDDE